MKLGIGAFVTDLGMRPAALARAVEERGFECLLTTEHSHIPVHYESAYPNGGEMPDYYRHCLDPFVVLSAAAAVTSTLTLGTSISLIVQRDVVQLAKEVASLDHLSEGRFFFGVGAGWLLEEMMTHGTDPATRGALMDEQLQALKAIWTQEKAEFHGKYVDFEPLYAWPKPVQKPHPPIYVGGQSKAGFRRIAHHGDGWVAGAAADAADVPGQIGLAKAAGLDIPITVFGADHRTPDVVSAYRDEGVERVGLLLEPASESETLVRLDEMAKLIDRMS